MSSTAAPNGSFFLQEVDATAASFGEGELTAVETPPQVATRFPSRKMAIWHLGEPGLQVACPGRGRLERLIHALKLRRRFTPKHLRVRLQY